MASQKQFLLVALLLTISLGCCHGSEQCRVRKDCPPCKIGVPLCEHGKCTCFEEMMLVDDLAIDGRKICSLSKDCPKCKNGKALCLEGICTCTDDITTQKDPECVCPPMSCPIPTSPVCVKGWCYCE